MTPDVALDTAIGTAGGLAVYGPLGIFCLVSLALNVFLLRALLASLEKRLTDAQAINKDVTGGMFSSTAAMSGLTAGVQKLNESSTEHTAAIGRMVERLDRLEGRK